MNSPSTEKQAKRQRKAEKKEKKAAKKEAKAAKKATKKATKKAAKAKEDDSGYETPPTNPVVEYARAQKPAINMARLEQNMSELSTGGVLQQAIEAHKGEPIQIKSAVTLYTVLVGCTACVKFGPDVRMELKIVELTGNGWVHLENTERKYQQSHIAIKLADVGEAARDRIKQIKGSSAGKILSWYRSKEEIVFDTSYEPPSQRKDIYTASRISASLFRDVPPSRKLKKSVKFYLGQHNKKDGPYFKEVAEAYLSSEDFDERYNNFMQTSNSKKPTVDDMEMQLERVGVSNALFSY